MKNKSKKILKDFSDMSGKVLGTPGRVYKALNVVASGQSKRKYAGTQNLPFLQALVKAETPRRLTNEEKKQSKKELENAWNIVINKK